MAVGEGIASGAPDGEPGDEGSFIDFPSPSDDGQWAFDDDEGYAYDDDVEPPPLNEALRQLLPADTSARALKAHLDEYVIGQDPAKISLSVLFSMHLGWFEDRQALHKAPNALAVGPTGVGKTHTITTLARYLQLPVAIVDSTSLVPSGANGHQIEDVLEELVASAQSILEGNGLPSHPDAGRALAERGVIFLDEFDKLRDDGSGSNIAAWNRTTQRRLLKLTEGSVLNVGVARGSLRRTGGVIDTSGILIVAGGAFAGIESLNIRSARGDAVNRVFRGSGVISHDVVSYGFLPELIARLSILMNFNQLSAKNLLSIMQNRSISPSVVWENHFARLGKELVIEGGAQIEVARMAASLNMGARGLQQVLFPLLASRAFEFETSSATRLTITAEMVTERD